MKAVKFYGIGDVRTDDIPAVVAPDDQALIQVLYGGICGSDLHIYRKGMFVEKLEETMGHEFVGRIISSPEGSGFQPGDMVVGDPRVPCGQCQSCWEGTPHRCDALGFIGEVRPGGFAELLALEPEKLVLVPEGTDPKRAAVAEPLAVAVHACRAIAASEPKNVAVVGAGPIGLLITCLLKGEYKIEQVSVVDRDDFRRSMAVRAGADRAEADLSDFDIKFDCAIDAVGLEVVLNAAINAVRPGGSIYISAIYEHLPVVDVNALVSAEKRIFGNNAYSFQDLEEAVRLIAAGNLDLDWLVTRILPADQAAEGFRLLTAPAKTDLKILLDFNGE